MNEPVVVEAPEPEIEVPVRSLRANFSWTFVGYMVYAACQACMLIVVARLLDEKIAGLFVLATAVSTPWIMLTNLALRQVQATDQRREYEFADYLGLRLVSCALGVLAICVVAAVAYSGEVVWVIAMMGIAKGVEAISEIVFGLLQRDERMDRISVSLMIKGPLSLVGLGLGLYLTKDVFWGVVGIAISRAVVLLSFDFRNASKALNLRRRAVETGSTVRTVWSRSIAPRWDWQTMKRLVILAFPLGVATMLISLTTTTPIYFLEHDRGKADVGFFGTMASLTFAGTLVVSALGQSTMPRLAKYYFQQQTAAYWWLLARLIVIGIGIGSCGLVLAVIAGPTIMGLVYGNAFAQYPRVLNWIVAGWTITTISSFLGYAISAARLFHVQPFVQATAVLGIAAFCYFAVPQYGMIGAALASGVGGLLQIIGYSVVFLFFARAAPNA